jgi:WD40 repeat protein
MISSVAFSHDSKYICTGSEDKTAKIWNAQSAQLIHTLQGHSAGIESVAFSHDSKYICTGSYDQTAKIWNAQSAQLIHSLQGHSQLISSVAFSHDSKYICTGSGDETAKIYNSGLYSEQVTASVAMKSSSVATKHVMISYSWNVNKPLVEEFSLKLAARGIEVWRDEVGSSLVSKMHGSTDEIMAEAVENSAHVIVFCSQEYKDSFNCKRECQYARKYEAKGRVKLIYVMLQEGYETKQTL